MTFKVIIFVLHNLQVIVIVHLCLQLVKNEFEISIEEGNFAK